MFSVRTGWCSEFFIRSASSRTRASVTPPAGYGTMIEIGREG
ncbi:MAG: hypothetical protein WBF58_19480 [Xanthobacteraceae bacterium]